MKIVRKLRDTSVRDLLAVGVPAVALLAAGFWLAAQFVKPAPPDHLTLGTGSDGGAYQHFAARYKAELARFDVKLAERATGGSAENLALLLDPDSGVDAAFIQGGTPGRLDDPPLVSLGSLYFEPLWVFYRGRAGLTRLDQLAGKRLAIGGEGSGTRALATELLRAHGMLEGATRLEALSGLAAVAALERGELDAVFVVGAPHSAAVWVLLHTPGVALMSFQQAEAYTRRLPYLTRLTLPDGAISLQRKLPPGDVTLVAPVATLVAKADIHPALADLLLQAMSAVHGEAGLFQRAGEFPSGQKVDFPLSPRAERHYRAGPPFLQRYLPFWLANFLDRILVMLLPVVALLIPMLRFAPQLYTWRVRSRIYRWYGELKHLELQAEQDIGSRSREQWLAELSRIDDCVNRVSAPLAHRDFVYTLRMHIALVRQGIFERLQATPEKP